MSRMVVAVVICGSVLAACGGSSVEGAPVATTGSTNQSAHLTSVSRGTIVKATLDVVSGTSTIDIGVADLRGRLMTAATPATSGQRPTADLSPADVVDLSFASNGGSGQGGVRIVLDRSVEWTIELDGGATTERLDLAGGKIRRVDLASGVTRATIALPPAAGTQVVHETGGASELTVTSPTTATRVAVGGGASRVTIGGDVHAGVSGGTTYTDPRYRGATDRLSVELVGGVSSFTI